MLQNNDLGKKENLEFNKTEDGLFVNLKGNRTISSLDLLHHLKTLSFIKGLQVKKLIMNNTKISDLSPLIGEPLEEIRMRGTGVKNINPLLKVESLKVFYTGKMYPKKEIEKLPQTVKIEINPGKNKK